MYINDEVTDHLNDQQALLMDISISVQNMSRLRETVYDSEAIAKKHDFFRHHYYQLKFISIIQLTKLFGSNLKNDRRGFFALINLLRNGKLDYLQLAENFEVKPTYMVSNDGDLKEVLRRNQKKLKESAPIIHKITEARNKVYAHSDPAPNTQKVLFEDLQTLFALATQIHNDFNFSIFHTTSVFITKYWDVDYPLKAASIYQKRRLEAIEKKKHIE
jgi:hypothetical protein